jgi:hypothetical protein
MVLSECGPSSVADVSADEPRGVTYARTAGPEHVGTRVVVRRRLPDGGYGDLLGTLVSWSQDGLVVRDRHDAEHAVPLADVVAAKPVPPPPERRS